MNTSNPFVEKTQKDCHDQMCKILHHKSFRVLVRMNYFSNVIWDSMVVPHTE